MNGHPDNLLYATKNNVQNCLFNNTSGSVITTLLKYLGVNCNIDKTMVITWNDHQLPYKMLGSGLAVAYIPVLRSR